MPFTHNEGNKLKKGSFFFTQDKTIHFLYKDPSGLILRIENQTMSLIA